MSLDILYADEQLVAIDKPSGLLVHRSKIDRHETRFAMQMLRDQIGRHVYPVHRLDKPTSGVLLFALNPDTARIMTERFTQRQVTKRYLAIVRGYTDDQGRIDKPLRKEYDPMTDRQARRDKEAQSAITEYRTLARAELPYPVRPYDTGRYSLLCLHPLTGRRHQIRRHLNHIAHPVIGDVNHGDRYHNQFFRRHFDCHRLLLMAQGLEFIHPVTNGTIRVEASMDDAYVRVMSGIGWSGFATKTKSGACS
jgi:tRNA pseudouridine65 synthase